MFYFFCKTASHLFHNGPLSNQQIKRTAQTRNQIGISRQRPPLLFILEKLLIG